MTTSHDVAGHYANSALVAAIRNGLTALGKSPDTVTVEDLAPVDEFHIGGRKATGEVLDQVALGASNHVLDVGCGLGGAARLVATRYGCKVTGIDLTRDFVDAGNMLSQWVSLAPRVSLHQGSALAMPFADGSFDAAYMLHVGMNIADKQTLAGEIARVLRPGAQFAVYDVMQTGPGALAYPVPWATTADTSAVDTPQTYRAALEAAGFEVTAERNRRDFAMAFFAELKARTAAAGGPPPLGLHLIMGRNTPDKLANMIANIGNGTIAPVELIATKR